MDDRAWENVLFCQGTKFGALFPTPASMMPEPGRPIRETYATTVRCHASGMSFWHRSNSIVKGGVRKKFSFYHFLLRSTRAPRRLLRCALHHCVSVRCLPRVVPTLHPNSKVSACVSVSLSLQQRRVRERETERFRGAWMRFFNIIKSSFFLALFCFITFLLTVIVLIRVGGGSVVGCFVRKVLC